MAAPLAVNAEASLWGPYKNILQTVENTLLKKQPEAVHLLDIIFKRHKPDFISLFKNPPKNAQQRERLQKSSTDGIAIKGQQGTCPLPEQLIKEAFILSDLFDIGEVSAVELLLAGEHQQPHFPGLTRGLVAVLLYWDGKRCIADSLLLLIQARKGKTFTLEISPELVSMATYFTDDLMQQGLSRKILTLVSEIDVNNEFEKLQKERGLGNEKHRKEVSDLIKGCRQSLAECLFSWACQSPLSKEDTLLLIEYLEKVSVEADGSLDRVNLTILMALLYCIDVGFLEQGTEDREDLMQQSPLLTEKQYISSIHTRLQDPKPWKLPGLQATVRLAWGLTLRGISQLSEITALAEFTEADEAMAELAIGGNVFLFLTDAVVLSDTFFMEEFFIRRIHKLTTDFLTLMPMKVKQLRNRAEEDSRLIHMSIQMGNEPPTLLRRDLEHLMLLIGELYRDDPFHLELGLEYWCPTEPLQNTTLMGSYLGVAHQRPPQRQVVLSKFVRQMSDLLPATLYIPYLKMLCGLASGPQCAHYCFSLLKANGSSHAENLQAAGGSPVSWEHFFRSLMLYHEHLRRDMPSADSIHQRHPQLRGITQRELDGLIACLQLTAKVIEWSESARLALCEHAQWTPVVVILGLLQCSIPPILKAELINTLAAFGKSPEIAASLWQSLEYTQILQTVRTSGQSQGAGIERYFSIKNLKKRNVEGLPIITNSMNSQTQTIYAEPDLIAEDLFEGYIHTTLSLPSNFNPPKEDVTYIDLFQQLVMEDFNKLPSKSNKHTRLWPNEERALKSLANDSNLVIRQADKGGGIVLQDYKDYVNEAYNILLNVEYYRKLDADPTAVFLGKLLDVLEDGSGLVTIPVSLLLQNVSQKLMAGFVECLDSEEAEEFDGFRENPEAEMNQAHIHHKTKIHILNLLITSLEMKSPNLALYLLGYELKKPVCTTNLQDSGVLGCPRTCLHSILDILAKGTKGRTGPVAVWETPYLAELCYQVIYQLCACSETSGPTMRYLRTSQDFLFSQLQHLPFSVKDHEISALNQMSWLMKTSSIELRITSLNRQRSHTQRLLHLLLDDMPIKPYAADGESGMEDESRTISGFLHFDTTSKVRRKILSILDSIDFTQEIPEPLQLDFFDRSQIEQVIANCEHKNRRGQTVCNVKLLHRVLVAEVNALQGMAAIGQRPLLMEYDILHCGGFQRVRAHLYGSLLYYLQIAQKPDEPDTLEAGQSTMWERLTAPEDVFSKLQRDNLSIIETYGAALMEVVCRDACDGHEIGRMLALALLDRIVSIDKQQQWLIYLSNSGYLKVLVDSLAQDDTILQNLLTPQPPLLKALYIYESKMAFLTRVAKSQQGALELLRCGVIVRLAQCQVYDMRPETDPHGVFGMREAPVFIPAPVERYRQILLPALQLCQVILTSSTAQHLQAGGQVLQFLIAHSDTTQAILRSQEGSLGSLQELALLTGIISKAALPGILSELDISLNEGSIMELQGHIGRFQRQCLGLLTRFGGSDRLRQLKLQDDVPQLDRVSKRDDMELAMQQISSNVMEYCQSLIIQTSPTFQQTVCLFTPSLAESTSRDGPRQDSQVSILPSWRLPGLGVVLYLLKQSANDFFTYYDIHRQSVSKLQNVEQLPPDEIKELCLSEMPVGVDKISTTQKYSLARRRLVKLINSRAKLLSVCSYIIETCLFILWRHLEYYLLYCIPTDTQDSLFSNSTFSSRRFQDTLNTDANVDSKHLGQNRVSQQDIEMLQREGANVFGESLQKRLLDIEGLYCKVRSRHSFIQALVRRIRGLLRVSRT
ncbi:nuclear pore complex protein Nup205 [Bombina bombina]|uniref:nuclear pore complex protein Nup205 n=1 Tax=Bombina bombina TaxID=8345 RepID=UPI00235B172F|nr:nuclear pore complex protein Nup205 [Bombina bombina]